jgi:hypothetical protein
MKKFIEAEQRIKTNTSKHQAIFLYPKSKKILARNTQNPNIENPNKIRQKKYFLFAIRTGFQILNAMSD